MRLLATIARRVRRADMKRRIVAAASVRREPEEEAERVAAVRLPSSSMLPGAPRSRRPSK